MLATLTAGALLGLDGFLVTVEADVASGLPSFHGSGLPTLAMREARERIAAAIANSGFYLPPRRITVNLAPADVIKPPTYFDVPIAVAMLAGAGQLAGVERLARYMVVGELGLDGTLRQVAGALSLALAAREAGLDGIVVPVDNAREAAAAGGIEIRAARTLKDVVHFLEGTADLPEVSIARDELLAASTAFDCDYSEVKGHEHVKRALEVAAAGSHHALLVGPPGAGKTMLAHRLPTILPPLTFDDALEVSRIHSVAGLLHGPRRFVATPPFRNPHTTISDVGLIGGGARPRPGEAALAHHGVLFLDELAEYRRNVLESLRQPLEAGETTLSRGSTTVTYPSRFMLVAAMNPCPCGHHGDTQRRCTCAPAAVQRYLGRVSGPVLDRIDIHVEVPAVRYRDLSDRRTGEPSESIRARVSRAREIQRARFNGRLVHANAVMTHRDIREHCAIGEGGEALLRTAITRLGLSARAYHRVLKVARTIADLDGGRDITTAHVSEAIQYRSLDRRPQAPAT
jgi:magnesium chelatase family protein